MSVILKTDGFVVNDLGNDGNGVYLTLTREDTQISFTRCDDLYIARLTTKGVEKTSPIVRKSQDELYEVVNDINQTAELLSLIGGLFN